MANKPEAIHHHCDGWYFDNVCPSRGRTDSADIRYTADGWTAEPRCECKTAGMSPLHNWAVCPHCVEYRKLFRPEDRPHNGKTEIVTHYQAKNDEEVTVKAYKRKCDLMKYLKAHPDTFGAVV